MPHFMYNNSSDTSKMIFALPCAIFVNCDVIHNGVSSRAFAKDKRGDV